jgi:protein-S-isoprenylcysteine O-methyltransferase Ste14
LSTPSAQRRRPLSIQRLRVPLGFLVGGLYLWYAPRLGTMTPLTLGVGAAIALVGVLVRAWAAGHIVKNDRLATTGPYAHTRNPLYFGSFLIAAGFAVAAHPALLLLVIAFWVLVYAPTIQRERVHVSGKFPDAYARYEANVPAFFPRPSPWRDEAAEHEGFSLPLYMRHGEWRAGLVYVLVVAWFAFQLARKG